MLTINGVAIADTFAEAFPMTAARDSLEYLRALQHEKPRLGRDEFAAALSDLCKCYRGQGLDALAAECQEEVRRLLHGA